MATKVGKIQDSPELTSIIVEAVVKRVFGIISHMDKIGEYSSQDLIGIGLCDPVRLFVKDEPHASRKFASGKYRLISAFSIVDQIVDRMLYTLQNKTEILNWTTCPSKPGLSLADDGLMIMAETFQDMLGRGKLRATDISGWDWSVQEWELWFDAERRIQLAGAEDDDLWSLLVKARTFMISHKVFALPDGELVSQILPGVQGSGLFNTSSGNSVMRNGCELVAEEECAEELGIDISGWPLDKVAMGDDAVAKHTFDEVLVKLKEYGHTVRECEYFTDLDGVEFCSHTWNSLGLASPNNVAKTLFRFFSHRTSSPDLLGWYVQLAYELRHVKGIDALLNYARVWAEDANKSYINGTSKSANDTEESTSTEPLTSSAAN